MLQSAAPRAKRTKIRPNLFAGGQDDQAKNSKIKDWPAPVAFRYPRFLRTRNTDMEPRKPDKIYAWDLTHHKHAEITRDLPSGFFDAVS